MKLSQLIEILSEIPIEYADREVVLDFDDVYIEIFDVSGTNPVAIIPKQTPCLCHERRKNFSYPPFWTGRAEPDETGTLCAYKENLSLIKEAFAEGYSQGSSDAQDYRYVPEFATKKYMDDLKQSRMEK